MNDLIGQSLGRYHILEQLGEGGMAIVYKAYDTRLENEVAVKVIRTENLAPSILERALKRFEREAKALAKLTHANIVKVLDYGEYQGRPYLVMPYLPGGTLKSCLTGQPMPYEQAVHILLPVARALAYAHEQGMIHRDVKPSNILITHSGDPMLTDFGIAKIIDDEATMDLTGTSAAVGTPEYMAPEQATARSIDPRADIYSLGIVLYELVTGRKPYQADTPMAVLIKQATEPLPRPTKYAPGLPENIEHILIKALAKNVEDRYAGMQEMIRAMQAATSDTSASRQNLQSLRSDASPAQKNEQPVLKNETRAQTMDTGYTRLQEQDDAGGDSLEMTRNELQSGLASRPSPRQSASEGSSWFFGPALWIGVILISLIVLGMIAINSNTSSARATPQAEFPGESEAAFEQETAMAADAATLTMQAYQQELAAQTAAAGTATAHARLVDVWNAVDSEGQLVYGPESGVLESKDDGYLELAYTSLVLKDFVISADFQNPDSGSGGSWNYGFLLRDLGGNDQFRLVFDSASEWSFYNATPDGNFEYLVSGGLDDFNTSPGGRNRIKVIFKGTKGAIYVNGNLISELPLTLRVDPGNLELATDMSGNEESGMKIAYSNFTVREILSAEQRAAATAAPAAAAGASYQAVIVSGSTRFGPAPLHVTLYSELRDQNGSSVCQNWECSCNWTILKNGNEIGTVQSSVFVYDFSTGDYSVGLTICKEDACATDWTTIRATK